MHTMPDGGIELTHLILLILVLIFINYYCLPKHMESVVAHEIEYVGRVYGCVYVKF